MPKIKLRFYGTAGVYKKQINLKMLTLEHLRLFPIYIGRAPPPYSRHDVNLDPKWAIKMEKIVYTNNLF